MAYTGMLRLSQSPSCLISSSGSWPQREALALARFCRRKHKKSTARASENFELDLQASLGDAPPERGSFFQFSDT